MALSSMNEIEEIKKKIIPILKEFKVTRAGIFGSYARGEQKKKSDIDILAEIDKKFSLLQFAELKLALEVAVKKKVDLVEYECVRREIRKNVLKDEIPIIR